VVDDGVEDVDREQEEKFELTLLTSAEGIIEPFVVEVTAGSKAARAQRTQWNSC